MGTLMMFLKWFQSYINPHSKCVQQDVRASAAPVKPRGDAKER